MGSPEKGSANPNMKPLCAMCNQPAERHGHCMTHWTTVPNLMAENARLEKEIAKLEAELARLAEAPEKIPSP